jgi:lysophospholipase L1-like esterase
MTTNLLLFAGFVLSMLLMSFNYGRKKTKVLFFGDSITNQGMRRNGYITLLSRLIKQEVEEEKFDLIGAGVDGNKVGDLLQRVEADVLSRGPDIVVVFIGVNDVWHKQTGAGTEIDTFETSYERLIEKLKVGRSKIILCTLAVIGEKVDESNKFDEDLMSYNEVIKNIAYSNDFPLIDLRKAFMDYNLANNLENKQAGILTTDGVHLNDEGNELVAREMWKVIKDIKL